MGSVDLRHRRHRFFCFHKGSLLAGVVFFFLSAPAFCEPSPDLVVERISVSDDCSMMITLKNQGPGPLPPTAYLTGSSPALQLYKDNQPFGAWSLNGIDPGRALQQPGGIVSWTRSGELIAGSMTIRAVIDPSNVVAEADEANNERSEQLTCNPPLPDLAVTQITFSEDCRSQVQITNLGDAGLPDSRFSASGAYILRFVDGVNKGWIRLGNIDPGKSLKNPGGTVIWTDLPEFRAAGKVRFKINQAGQEKSTSNNDMEVSVPSRCEPAGGGDQPDLVVAGLSVNPQCQLEIILKNNGSGQLPATAYQTGSSPTLQLYKNNQPYGAWSLDGIDPGRALRQPGGTVTWTRSGEKIAGSATIKAQIDASNLVAEADEANNETTSQLTCSPSLPDLAVTGITFTQDCRTQVHLKNVGKEPLRDNIFLPGGAFLMRYVDGADKGWIRLQDIDPGKTLKNPGGTKVWTDYPEFKATQKIKFAISQAGQEASTANNSLEIGLPEECKPSEAPAPENKTVPQMPKRLLKKRPAAPLTRP